MHFMYIHLFHFLSVIVLGQNTKAHIRLRGVLPKHTRAYKGERVTRTNRTEYTHPMYDSIQKLETFEFCIQCSITGLIPKYSCYITLQHSDLLSHWILHSRITTMIRKINQSLLDNIGNHKNIITLVGQCV